MRPLLPEGKLATLFSGDDHSTGLAPPSQLGHASCLAALSFTDLAHPYSIVFDECHVRRLDLACDVRFASAAQGQLFLKAMAGLNMPRLKKNVWDDGGQVETIYYRTPKRSEIRLRVYDKTKERGDDVPGTVIRLEQQHRFVGAAQPAPSVVAMEDLGIKWKRQLEPWEVADGVVVADLDGVQKAILNAVENGTMTAFTAERLIGNLCLRASGMGRDWWSSQGKRHVWGRRERELRELGLILDDDGLASSSGSSEQLALAPILRAVQDVWSPG